MADSFPEFDDSEIHFKAARDILGHFEILLEVFLSNTPRNHCITHTNHQPVDIYA